MTVVALFVSACGDRPPLDNSLKPAARRQPGRHALPRPIADDERQVSDEDRLDALRRAQVWRPPQVPVNQAHLGQPVDAPTAITCRFALGELGGTTPKFDCLLDTGEKIRIKYGNGPEIPAEAATTRLLACARIRRRFRHADSRTALLRMSEESVFDRQGGPCRTCRADLRKGDRLQRLRGLRVGRARAKVQRPAYRDRRQEGWAFSELDHVDAAKGGAPREHVDALRLLAVFLAHWDNKTENQRLVCLTPRVARRPAVREPFSLVHDVGATFGPQKGRTWRRGSSRRSGTIARSCRVSMRHLPYDGATFGTVRISEGGPAYLSPACWRSSPKRR